VVQRHSPADSSRSCRPSVESRPGLPSSFPFFAKISRLELVSSDRYRERSYTSFVFFAHVAIVAFRPLVLIGLRNELLTASVFFQSFVNRTCHLLLASLFYQRTTSEISWSLMELNRAAGLPSFESGASIKDPPPLFRSELRPTAPSLSRAFFLTIGLQA